tara:strand:+ start:445 stop:804 length:360 start_codon:yes stop_codon:yes gene_type:complete
MPRLPVDNVQEFRVTLGQYERERLDTIITALTINKISSPVITLLSDVSAMTLITSAYIAYRYGPEVADQLAESYDNLNSLVNDTNSILAAAEPILGNVGFLGISYTGLQAFYASLVGEN